MNNNQFFKQYGSKIKPLYIPIPNFEFFHAPTSEDEVDSKFIGRKAIRKQLRTWLENGKTGVYLVTGYRGMGKSSFVGKVLNEISEKPSQKESRHLKYRLSTIIGIIGFFIYLIYLALTLTDNKYINISTYIILILSIFLCIICLNRKSRLLKKEDRSKQRVIPIKINLGHEILKERDILSLIAHSIEHKYKEYYSNTIIQWDYFCIKIVSLSLISAYISYHIFKQIGIIIHTGVQFGNNIWYKTLEFINGVLYLVRQDLTFGKYNLFDHLLSIIVFLIVFGIAFYLWKFAEVVTDKIRPRNPHKIAKRLNNLNLRINSTTNEDASPFGGGIAPYGLGISFYNKRVRNFPIADVREIEQQLSWLLDEIDKSGKEVPRFIIIFDEIDKIDPAYNKETIIDSELIPEFEHAGSGFVGGATSRKRKQNLLKMLANMKYFISTAKAKFVFITGRELYDAFLADSSDREFAIGSIFNNVIYVDSFLSSGNNPKDITFKAEQYICKQLLPETTLSEDDPAFDFYYTFKTYENYLALLYILDFHKKRNGDKTMLLTIEKAIAAFSRSYEDNTVIEIERIIKDFLYIETDREEFRNNRYAIDKAIIQLQQFSVYLSHVSNGAPKKITIHFEKYIEKIENANDMEGLIIPHDSSAYENNKKNRYYLAFHYRSQQKIGFIHYMAFPLINAIFDNASLYGDKLLVTAFFLTNQIYKYHNNGFSWRNLENIHELLDINKSPELREFINVIISYMKRSHISTTVSGLYHFKFPMKIMEEISIMSRLSEEVSALFNFSLDDSVSVKKHYSKLLHYYSTRYREKRDEKSDLHHLISGIHHILGDLHMLDEEYNEAIFEYQSCVESMQREPIDNSDPHYPSHMLNLVRIMLKLGLTYEKRKTYNTAYITYNELISKLVHFRYIDEDELGLDYIQETRKGISWMGRENILQTANPHDKEKNDIYKKHIQTALDGKDTHFHFKGKDLMSQFHRELTPLKNALIVRLTLFEDIRLVYQALLAKLFVLEKHGLGGITRENVEMTEANFLYMYRFVYYKEKYIIAADFFRKLADILYYKNGFVNSDMTSFFMTLDLWDYNIENDILDYCAINGFEHYDKMVKVLNMKITKKKFKTIIDGNSYDKYIVYLDHYDEYVDAFITSDSFKLKNISGCCTGKGCFHVDREINETSLLFVNHSHPVKDNRYDIAHEKNILLLDETTESMFGNYDDINKRRIEYSKVKFCKDRRRYLLITGKNKRSPCYACLYYTRSLKIIMSNMLDSNKINRYSSKVLFFLEASTNIENLYSLKDDDLTILASSLDGLGNVMFCCTTKNDKITSDFINIFVTIISIEDTEKRDKNPFKDYNTSLSNLEKALLYFWTAAFYYKLSSNMKEASLCYKKVMHVLVSYLEVHEKEDIFIVPIRLQIKELKKGIISRALQTLYSHYENINMVEIQKLKWVFSKETYDTISLNELSFFPDAEELISLFYRMELLCWNSSEKGKNIYRLYKSMSLTQFRIENTVSERIVTLKFKAELNQRVLKKILDYKYENLFSQEFTYELFTGYLTYFTLDIQGQSKTIEDALGNYYDFFDKTLFNSNDIATRLDFVEYLLTDSIFCLSKIIETISPAKQTTLFTESFIADTYDRLFEMNQIYEYTYIMYKWCLDQDIFLLERKIKNIIRDRANPIKSEQLYTDTTTLLDEIKALIAGTLKQEEQDRAKSLLNTMLRYIGRTDVHLSMTNYHAEMALQKYRRAIEMHHGGKVYQEFISDMYLLEDDLNNNTCQFLFAIERYKNNCGIFNNRIKLFKSICKKSSLLHVDQYLNTETYTTNVITPSANTAN